VIFTIVALRYCCR